MFAFFKSAPKPSLTDRVKKYQLYARQQQQGYSEFSSPNKDKAEKQSPKTVSPKSP